MEEDNTKRRIIALIFGGVLIVIVIPLVFYYISRALDSYVGLNELLSSPVNWYIGLPIAIFGGTWSIISNIQLFNEGKGGPIPHPALETTSLVIRGVYKYSRNPMMFGYIILLIGLGFIFNSLFFLFLPNLMVNLPILLYIKLKEEKGLVRRFGEAYVQYKERTAFMFPRPPKKPELTSP